MRNEGKRGNPLAYCPACGYRLDAYSPLDEEEDVYAKEGDFSICGKCHVVLIFRADLTLRTASSKEYRQFKKWLKEWRSRKARKKMH